MRCKILEYKYFFVGSTSKVRAPPKKKTKVITKNNVVDYSAEWVSKKVKSMWTRGYVVSKIGRDKY